MAEKKVVDENKLKALNVQAIVARTYTILKIKNGSKHDGADICDDSTCCQAWISKDNRMARWEENKKEEYWNKIVTAVNQTKGKMVMYNGEPINAFFHANSGGVTESSLNIWGGIDYPYLKSVETAGEEGYTQYSSTVTLSKEELIQKLQASYPEIQIDFNVENAIQTLSPEMQRECARYARRV